MLLALLLACVTEDNFPSQLASAYCSGWEECDGEAFSDAYDDQAECREEQASAMDPFHACYLEHCDFDVKAASEFLTEYRKADCGGRDDALAESEEVYVDCTDDLELAACLFDAAF
jgi:hypothetical protein